MNDQEIYERARKRVNELKDFYTHLMVYVLVIGFLLVINLVVSPGFLWVIFPAGGWGIGLGIHAFTVWMDGPFGRQWEERKIRQLMEEQTGRKLKNDELFEE